MLINFPMAGQESEHPQLEHIADKIPTSTTHRHASLSIIVVKRSLKSLLTKFHAGYFRISLSLASQALLWKTIIGPKNDKSNLHRLFQTLHPSAFLVLWSFSLFILILLSILYILRCLFYFKLVKEEFFHHVGVSYLFAPWISWLFLLQSAPFPPKAITYIVLCLVFAVPILALDIKLYGEWFTKGKRLLSVVANPTSQMSVIGNLVGAQAVAHMGWKESAFFLFSIGMVHYLVVCVTLYQRMSGGNRLPAMLRPAFFLFFAAPSVASLAWESISGSFDTGSKLLFFLSLFIFTSLVSNTTVWCSFFLFRSRPFVFTSLVSNTSM